MVPKPLELLLEHLLLSLAGPRVALLDDEPASDSLLVLDDLFERTRDDVEHLLDLRGEVTRKAGW